ncbi:hypothetical protein [Marinobacter nauticus]|uniref:hypothetical protein n=1 Tax=Marinobacter nauticus TaxID=2743 RepID=UPI001C563E2C|nr:hypothetical protein [Marinobacter nauticus]MBW3199588.1 hypothetical protein [Marinobacter nauticus]MBY6184998.1 hypothetical protein [Marinobacter nauticus]
MNFEQMSFQEAVSHVQTMGGVVRCLFFSIPIISGISIQRGKQNRPHEPLIFPRVVFWSWFMFLVLLVMYFFTGAWYGENGPPPQEMAARSTYEAMAFGLFNVAIWVGLYLSTNPRPQVMPNK